MGVSQILFMYISSLINIAFKYNEYEKLRYAKIINEKACKQNES